MSTFLNFNSDCLVNVEHLVELYRDGVEVVLNTLTTQYTNGYETEQEATEAMEYYLYLIEHEEEPEA